MKRLIVAVAVLVAVSAFITTMLMVIYPGSFEWTAPVLCPDSRPDPFVVRYESQTRDGTAVNFTLFCMGERGQFTEVGSWRPLALLMAFVTGAMVALVAGLGVLAHLSRHHRPGAAPPGDDPEGAPVDAPEDAPVDAPPDPVR